MTRLFRLAFAALIGLAASTTSTQAAPAPRGEFVLDRDGSRVAAELLADADAVAPGGQLRVGVRFDLTPGWHVYWRHPGDAGAATELTWRATGAEIGPMRWPAPRVFREAEGLLTTYGYVDDVLFASEAVVLHDVPDTLRLEVDTRFVACRIECIPGRIRLAREIPVTMGGAPAPDAIRARFDLAETRLPRSADELGVVVAARASRPNARAGDDLSLALDVTSCIDAGDDCRPWTLDAEFANEAFVPAEVTELRIAAKGLSHAPSSPTPGARGFSLVLSAHAFEDVPELGGQRLRGVLPLSRPDGAAHLAIDVAVEDPGPAADDAAFAVIAALPAPPSDDARPTQVDRGLSVAAGDPTAAGAPSLAMALALGLLGGLILNLMPCVLPVLAIKIFAITDLARADRSHVVKHGFAYLGGVVASMAALASVVLMLRAAGTSVGWGFQLQDPVFLAAICTVLVVFAMNLFGVYEITLQPSGPGVDASHGPASPARSFFEGTLAVVLATPCTAPFLGTAVGFAFAGSGAVIFAIFIAIGVGLAAPYVLVTLVPGWARFVPRPGAWMLRVREALGFALLATVAWLAWVAGRALGVDAQGLLLAHLVVVGFLLWFFGTAQRAARPVAMRAIAGLTAMVVVASLALLPLDPKPVDAASTVARSSRGIDWIVFDRSAVERERAAGRPVFVDFTADWCITCKVNETVVLSDEAIHEELARWNYATFKADWTRRDEKIARELASWGRAGVPMYLVYPADPTQQPRLLSELLTLEATVQALRAAGNGGGA